MEEKSQRKLRILYLQGFRINSEILKQLVSGWSEFVIQKLDLVFLHDDKSHETMLGFISTIQSRMAMSNTNLYTDFYSE
ncbi:hypothetical protein CR513_59325, partial [Mucuna pruriens]